MRCLLAFAIGLALMLPAPSMAQGGLLSKPEDLGHVMSARRAHKLAASGAIVLVDVRSPWEWRETGVPATGFAITMHQDLPLFLKKLRQAIGGNASRPVALICASGARTTYLQRVLRRSGFTSLINVTEGMMGGNHGDGWIRHGLPLRQWLGRHHTRPVKAAAN